MFRKEVASGIQGRFRMAQGSPARLAGGVLHSAEGLPWAMSSDGSGWLRRGIGGGLCSAGNGGGGAWVVYNRMLIQRVIQPFKTGLGRAGQESPARHLQGALAGFHAVGRGCVHPRGWRAQEALGHG